MEKFGLKTLKSLQKNHIFQFIDQKKGQIHGNPVADGWAGTVMQKNVRNSTKFITDLPTYRPTRQRVESRVRD